LLDEIEHASIADETWQLADNYSAMARTPQPTETVILAVNP
jgi:hypothetical protein